MIPNADFTDEELSNLRLKLSNKGYFYFFNTFRTFLGLEKRFDDAKTLEDFIANNIGKEATQGFPLGENQLFLEEKHFV